MIKKILFALILILVLVNAAFAAGMKIGTLAHQNMSESEYAEFINSQTRNFFGWKILNTNHSLDDEFIYFGSLNSMLMALGADKIEEIALPEPVAEYVVNANSNFELSCALHSRPTHLALGFRNDDEGKELCERVNQAINAMKADRSLSLLTSKYMRGNSAVSQPDMAKFALFPNVKTLRVAVTGDLPPLDMTAPDGTPIGFNTAVLAEIGKRIEANIELVNIDSDARTAALMSNRVDMVFWYQVYDGVDKQPDAPDGVLISEPYYSWDKFLHLRHFVR
ncbi:MAG: transporter substrate-binding domain-containing protein [Synergistaceae bacterium]|nr:transporter substrate-binding domain-containing protein [Synergistaceae bacterium]MBQ4418143.1 transporter substrate-binding domain-containing protein [Synergistaceae bacterium]MBQ9581599.1 transporter substrate-binding domain-containing protein [Synergistaceae bacterium]MBR0221171.1 transporter substrate-binding domain-containing protein [Synergistaceae bacterium]